MVLKRRLNRLAEKCWSFFILSTVLILSGLCLSACTNKDKGSSSPSSGNPSSSNGNSAVRASYLVAIDQNAIKTFAVTSAGTVTLAKTLAVSGVGNYAVGHPTANFVYAITNSGNAISSYSIALDGTLTELAGSPAALANYHEHLAVDPKGRFLYSADGISGLINIFKINSTTGALTAVSSTVSCGNDCFATLQAVDASGTHYYVAAQGADGNTNGVYSYSINQTTGELTALAGSPYLFTTEGNGPYGLVISGDGKYLITGNTGNTAYYGGLISGYSSFSINPSTGVLTYIGSIQTSVYPMQMSTDSSGHIFSADSASTNLLIVQLSGTGLPTTVTSLANGVTSNGIFTDPTSGHLYSTTTSTLFQFGLSTAPSLAPLSPASLSGFTNGFGLGWATYR